MGPMTARSARTTLTYTGDQAVTISPSVHPVPRTVAPGGTVQVDASAVESLTGSASFAEQSPERGKGTRKTHGGTAAETDASATDDTTPEEGTSHE